MTIGGVGGGVRKEWDSSKSQGGLWGVKRIGDVMGNGND
jgi:hypothetical protein